MRNNADKIKIIKALSSEPISDEEALRAYECLVRFFSKIFKIQEETLK